MRAASAAADPPDEPPGTNSGCEAFFRVDRDKRVKRCVQSRDAIEEELGHLRARDFLLSERGGKLFERSVQHGIQDSGLNPAIRSPWERGTAPARPAAPPRGIARAGRAR